MWLSVGGYWAMGHHCHSTSFITIIQQCSHPTAIGMALICLLRCLWHKTQSTIVISGSRQIAQSLQRAAVRSSRFHEAKGLGHHPRRLHLLPPTIQTSVRADERVIGLNVWHYDLGPAKGGEYEPGLLGLPSVLRAWQAIGREILSGKQGAIDFGLP